MNIAQNQANHDLYMLREKAARDSLPHEEVVRQVEAHAFKMGYDEGERLGIACGQMLARKQRREDRKEGRRDRLDCWVAKGILIGQIKFVQQMCALPRTPSEVLVAMPDEELQRLWADLEARLPGSAS